MTSGSPHSQSDMKGKHFAPMQDMEAARAAQVKTPRKRVPELLQEAARTGDACVRRAAAGRCHLRQSIPSVQHSLLSSITSHSQVHAGSKRVCVLEVITGYRLGILSCYANRYFTTSHIRSTCCLYNLTATEEFKSL